MKLTRNLSARLLCAGLVIFAAAHFVSSARENAPVVRVETTPVNRDARLGASFSPVVKKAAPSVVNIYTTRFIKERPAWNPFQNDPVFRQFFGGTRKKEGLGSGVIVSPDGYILTANHVVADADEIKISFGENKKEFPARLVGRDDLTDVAVLKIDASGLPAVTLADSDLLEVGDVVLAIGNPFGVGQTVTSGIISALARTEMAQAETQVFLQTDAAINPGNSGGALVSLRGELIGINSAIISPGGGNVGIGFAIPINMARLVMDQIVEKGRVDRGRIGVSLQDIHPAADGGRNEGARIAEVSPGSPAEVAGLRKGDIVLKVDGRPIHSAAQLRNRVGLARIGEQVKLTIERAGIAQAATVAVGPAAEPPLASATRKR